MLALVLAGCQGSAEPPPNVLLVVVDTLRRDRVSAYPDARVETPTLEGLAASGWTFDRASAPRAKTTPSIATLFTGRYPHDHGVRDLTVPLRDDVPTLAERLAAGGYRTAAIVGNFVLVARRSGLDRGFASWTEELPDRIGVPPHDAPQRTAGSITDGALALLGLGAPSADGAGPREAELAGDAPWFLYLHYMDPHGAYAPPAEFVQRPAAPEPVSTPIAPTALHRPRVADYNVPPDARLFGGGFDAALVRARYDGEVAYVDRELGRLFAALDRAALLDDTLVIVTSDHGESLGEHRYYFEHGLYAYEATVGVPLIVRPPARWGADPGRRGGDLSLADVAPTVLELLGLPELEVGSDGPAGESRADAWRGGSAAPRPVWSVKTERADLDGTVQLRAVRRGTWKLIRGLAFRTRAGVSELVQVREELYDLAQDPGETVDLSAAPPSAAPLAELRADLDRLLEADARLRQDALAIQADRERLEREAADDIQRLRALGYED
ncbi:MAG: sulfatase [Planctomycetota bacterium]